MHIAIVGAGQAGAALAARLRALGHKGPVTLIGAEPAAPYQRPPLSKAYLLGDMPLDRLLLRAPEFWAAQDIRLVTGVAVTALDPVAQTLTMGAEVLHWDQLALTTGAQVRRLPAAMGGDLAGVHYVRTLADVDGMAPEFTAGRRVLIVGGGYIGLEAAAVAAKKGLHVTLVEAAQRILQRVAAAETASWFRDLHMKNGVELIEGVSLFRLTGQGGVTGADLADGRHIPCDFAIVGVGILPDTALAGAAGLVLDNGIAVDAQGRTSAPQIWAAGDCASFPYRGGRLRLESVPNAIDMADCVAANILGGGTAYVPKPWFWSDQYEVKLQIAGLNTGYDRIVVRDTGTARSHWYYAGDRLLAVDAMNDPRAFMVARRLIEAGRSADPARVADPATDLKTLMG
ncbi:NAD(P)/FAD-dependent oxidoreductase [Gemmobacter sp.]|uniref:NAD(P)/FAD-dependent oxidoreductase n=1 Tax=Gemmobacter sp. TaxID=1898957 RepID=UPI002AFF21CF|nr:FAD-dependent oxidoreductase [Gemmobacter sp.]